MMITSRENKYIKEVVSLKNKKYRNKLNLFIMEGADFLDSIPEDFIIRYFLISETYFKSNGNNFSHLGKTFIVIDEVFYKCADTINSKGVICIIEKKEYSLSSIENMKILVCDNVQDPGNMGTIFRTAESAGFNLILLNKGCCDIYNPKAIRSTAGAIFNIPFKADLSDDNIIDFLDTNGINLYVTSLDTDKYYYDLDYNSSFALCVGNESNGVCETFIDRADELIKIPMIGKSQSLNVAVAASILIYETVRQNKI